MPDINKNEKLLSIICPVHNEELAIPLFYQRLKAVLNKLTGFSYELIFTNNRSTDNSLSEIHKLQKIDANVKVLTFSRNFGYQASILAGMTYANGDAAIVIDVDCEDPPELIEKFIEKWREGYHICYGIRGRRDEAIWVTWLRLLFYRVLKWTADTDIILDMAEFALLDRRVRNVLVSSKNTFPFLRAEIAYSGFKKIGIKYDRQKRIIGESHYNLWRMVIFGAAGIMSVSTFPLRMPIYFFPVLVSINILCLVMDVMDLIHGLKFIVTIDLLYICGLLTAQGLYLARIYKNGIGRPVYIVDWDLTYPRLTLGSDPL